jgi:hypothetical protein
MFGGFDISDFCVSSFVSDFDIRISGFLNFARFAFFARDLSASGAALLR